MPIYGDQPSTLGDIKEELLARLSILLEKSNGDIELSSFDKYINISVLDERCAVVDRAEVV